MDTDILKPKALFYKDIRYIIPEFQRPYVWDDDRWEFLWQDVRRTAEDYLEQLSAVDGNEAKAEENTAAHFFGAIVLQQMQTPTKEIEKRIVVDGQQRLTTLLLLLSAVREVCIDINLSARNLSKYVFNNEDAAEAEEDAYKLSPSAGDRESFKKAMAQQRKSPGEPDSRILGAHDFFRENAADWIGSGKDYKQRAEALETVITGLMQLVVIDLNTQDDPHVIFETLNARGTPLLGSDLIRNYVLSRDSSAAVLAVWDSLADRWWQDDTRQGRLLRPRIEVALNYWITMRKHAEIPSGKLFMAFKGYSEDKDIAGVSADLYRSLTCYQRFENIEGLNERAVLFQYRLGTMQQSVFMPIVMWLLTEDVPAEVRTTSFRAIESYLVRRMVYRATTKDYNSMIQSLLGELAKRSVGDADKVIIKFLASSDAPARQWPTDAQVRESLTETELYRLLSRGRLRLVLEGLEGELRTPLSEQMSVPRNLTIEHLMPQKWKEHWPLTVEDGERDAAKDRRNHLIHTIGNLTLISGRLNTAVSNGPWSGKRTAIRGNSNLSLNSDLPEPWEEWSEDTILERAKRLADIFNRVWPGPDSPSWG